MLGSGDGVDKRPGDKLSRRASGVKQSKDADVDEAVNKRRSKIEGAAAERDTATLAAMASGGRALVMAGGAEQPNKTVWRQRKHGRSWCQDCK
jgi:hypothetical protein